MDTVVSTTIDTVVITLSLVFISIIDTLVVTTIGYIYRPNSGCLVTTTVAF